MNLLIQINVLDYILVMDSGDKIKNQDVSLENLNASQEARRL